MKLKKKKKPRDSTKNSEAAGSNAQHYRSFASNLDRITDTFWKQLGKTMQEDLLEVQQGQVETLIKLEHAFKLALIKHRWGILAYRKFVDYIRDDRQNILDARPFFRERQTTFTAEISPALRDRRARGLFRFRVNWRFVMFVVQSYKWGASSEVRKIAEQIRKVRDELITVNLPLGLNRVKKFWAATQRSHLERMDLVQIACEGLMSAVDKFVPPFTTAFRDVIIGRITGNFIEQYSLHQDTIVETCDGTVKKIKDFVPGDRVYGVDDNGQPLQTTVLALHDHGELEAFEVTFEDGYSVVCSQNHKFLTNRGMVPIKEIVTSGLGVFCEPSAQAWRVECGVRGTILNEKGSFLSNRQDEGFLDGEIFATSPLSSTGSLVSRRVVRYRSVGTARMYDLEVEHPKHNFLLPNGIVTSNSQTLIHFYPDQRRKLYRAHSFIGKNPDVKTSGNFHDMVHKVNHGVEDKSRLTNESEIANLLAAASVVSLQDTDSSGGNPQGEYNGHSGNGNTRQIEKYAAPEESQPDVRVEEADCLFKLHAAAVTHLSLREKKLLMLKGISLDLLSQEKGGFREKDCQ
jgi:hypothetical protein